MDNETNRVSDIREITAQIQSKVKRFKVENDTNFISLRCPSCSHVFGLLAVTMDLTSNVNMHYTCPYCGKSHGVE